MRSVIQLAALKSAWKKLDDLKEGTQLKFDFA